MDGNYERTLYSVVDKKLPKKKNVVYVGVTNDPNRRELEHKRLNKKLKDYFNGRESDCEFIVTKVIESPNLEEVHQLADAAEIKAISNCVTTNQPLTNAHPGGGTYNKFLKRESNDSKMWDIIHARLTEEALSNVHWADSNYDIVHSLRRGAYLMDHPERVKALNELGMQWNIKDAKWEHFKVDIKKYLEEHKSWPLKGEKLRALCNSIRNSGSYVKNDMERIGFLDEIEFPLAANSKKNIALWVELLESGSLGKWN